MSTPSRPPTDKLVFDTSRMPLLVVTQIGVLGADEIAYNLACYQELFKRKQHFAVLYDARKGLRHDPAHNEAYTKSFNLIQGDMGTWCLGAAYIIDSVLMRMALRGFMLLLRPPCPTRCTAVWRTASVGAVNVCYKDQGEADG